MQTITLTGGTLFDVANRFLGDATQWTAIANANDIADPWLNGVVTLIIPAPLDGLAVAIVQQGS